MTTGMILIAIGIAGTVFTLMMQIVLLRVFHRQQKRLLEELEK